MGKIKYAHKEDADVADRVLDNLPNATQESAPIVYQLVVDLEKYMTADERGIMPLLVAAQDMYHIFRTIEVPKETEEFRSMIVGHAKWIVDAVKMGAIHQEQETCKSCTSLEEWAAMQTDVREEGDPYTSMFTFDVFGPREEDNRPRCMENLLPHFQFLLR